MSGKGTGGWFFREGEGIPQLWNRCQEPQCPSATEQPSWGAARGSRVQASLALQPQRELSSDLCSQPCPMPSLPLPAVPNLTPHRATPTPSPRDMELGQPEARLGSGQLGSSPSSGLTPSTHPSASLGLSLPFWNLEGRAAQLLGCFQF